MPEIVKPNGIHWIVVETVEIGEEIYADLGETEYGWEISQLLVYKHGGWAKQHVDGHWLYCNPAVRGDFEGEKAAYQYIVNLMIDSL